MRISSIAWWRPNCRPSFRRSRHDNRARVPPSCSDFAGATGSDRQARKGGVADCSLDGCVQVCIQLVSMDEFEWDPAKAAANLAKHKVDFADAALSLEDLRALTISDPDATDEERFVTLAADPMGRILITVYS